MDLIYIYFGLLFCYYLYLFSGLFVYIKVMLFLMIVIGLFLCVYVVKNGFCDLFVLSRNVVCCVLKVVFVYLYL